MQNKAKFRNAKNEYNYSPRNNYQQRTTNYQLSKTNPNQSQTLFAVRGAKLKQTQSNPTQLFPILPILTYLLALYPACANTLAAASTGP
jgi:hypothetical protein